MIYYSLQVQDGLAGCVAVLDGRLQQPPVQQEEAWFVSSWQNNWRQCNMGCSSNRWATGRQGCPQQASGSCRKGKLIGRPPAAYNLAVFTA